MPSLLTTVIMKNKATYLITLALFAGFFTFVPHVRAYDDPGGDMGTFDAGGDTTGGGMLDAGGDMGPFYDPGSDMGLNDDPGGDMVSTNDPGGDISGMMDPGGDINGTMDPGGDLHPTYDPAGDLYPTYDPAGDLYPKYDPAGDLYPKYDPAGDLYPRYYPGGDIYRAPGGGYSYSPCGSCGGSTYYSQPCCASSGYQYSYSAPVYMATCNCYSYSYRPSSYISGGIFTGSVVIPPEGPGNPQPPDSPVYPSHPLSYVNSPTYGQNYGGPTYLPQMQTAPIYSTYQQPQQYQNAAYGGNSQFIQVTQNPVQAVVTDPSYVYASARTAAIAPSVGPMVALSQVPYTGIDTDILFTIALVLLATVILGAIAYFLGFFKRGMFGKILLGIY